jgi:hypothetical protein
LKLSEAVSVKCLPKTILLRLTGNASGGIDRRASGGRQHTPSAP